MRLFVVPLTLAEANAFIAQFHRHHFPVVGHRFSIGVVDEDGVLRGVCVVGRPVARLAGHHRDVAEVSRLATDGTMNACSMLLGAAGRAAKALGYRRIQTYTLPEEGGASLRASGWLDMGDAGGGSWNKDGRPRRTDQPTCVKTRWELHFNRPSLVVRLPTTGVREQQEDLFGSSDPPTRTGTDPAAAKG